MAYAPCFNAQQEGWVNFTIAFKNWREARKFQKLFNRLKQALVKAYDGETVNSVQLEVLQRFDGIIYAGVLVELSNEVTVWPGEARTWDYPGAAPYAEGFITEEELTGHVDSWLDDQEIDCMKLLIEDDDFEFNEEEFLNRVFEPDEPW